MWLMFNKMADDVPSEPRTNQTVVSLLDHFRPPAPNGLSRTLPVLLWNSENREHMTNFRNVDCVVTNHNNVQDTRANFKTTN